MFLCSIEKTNRHSIKGIVLFVNPWKYFFYSGRAQVLQQRFNSSFPLTTKFFLMLSPRNKIFPNMNS